MQTFDGALFKLYKEGRIDQEEALKNADSPNNLRLRIKLDEKGESVEEPDKLEEDNQEDNNIHMTSTGISLSLKDIEDDDVEEEAGISKHWEKKAS